MNQNSVQVKNEARVLFIESEDVAGVLAYGPNTGNAFTGYQLNIII